MAGTTTNTKPPDTEDTSNGFLSVTDLTSPPPLATQTVTLPDGRGQVEIRSLTRAEMHVHSRLARENSKDAEQQTEIRTVSNALVNPKMSEEQVKTWFRHDSIRNTQAVVQAILALSGISGSEDEAKADIQELYKSPGD